MTAVSVVGSSGRVGASLVSHLSGEFDVRAISRVAGESMRELAGRAVADVSVVVNAAGVAHLERVDSAELEALHLGNVQLPSDLACAALGAGISLLHVSSVKASNPDESPYARSKSDGEAALRREYEDRFNQRELSITVMRPPALLIPPLDAGRLRKLRALRHVPPNLIPRLKLPVLTEIDFVRAVHSRVAELVAGNAEKGLSLVEFDRAGFGNLRDIATAFQRSDDSYPRD